MSVSVRLIMALGVAAVWLGGCAIGGFDLSSSSTSSAPPAPIAEPAVAPAVATTQQPPPQPVAQSAAAPPVAQPAVVQTSRQLPAVRAARAPPTPPPAADDDSAAQPMTTTRAREICWMATEENSKVKRDMDAKIKFVEKCVDEKLRSAGQ